MIVEFTTTKGDFVFIMQDGDIPDIPPTKYKDKQTLSEIILWATPPDFEMLIIGYPSTMKDADWDKVIQRANDKYCRDYDVETVFFKIQSATESGRTLMDSLKVYTPETLPQRPERMVPFKRPGYYTDRDKENIDRYKIELQVWEEAKARTGNWILIQKLK